jgi:signal transduction histidine kinase
MMDTFVYDLGPFNERLLTPDLNELMMRSLAVALLAAFGFYAQSMMNKLEKSDQRLARMNQCFLSFGPDPVENINSLTKLCGELLGASSSFYNRLDQGLMCSWGQWHTPAGFSCEGSPEGRICYDVINKGSEGVIVVNNLQETVYARTDPSVVGCGLKTYIGHAVRLGQDVVGSLCTFYHDEYVPREEDKRLLGIIASAVGVEEVRGQARNALRESERQMRKLSARLISAQEVERKRIARQLHDSIGQSLSAIKYSIEDDARAQRAGSRRSPDQASRG